MAIDSNNSGGSAGDNTTTLYGSLAAETFSALNQMQQGDNFGASLFGQILLQTHQNDWLIDDWLIDRWIMFVESVPAPFLN